MDQALVLLAASQDRHWDLVSLHHQVLTFSANPLEFIGSQETAIVPSSDPTK